MPCHGKNSVFASLVLPIRPRLNALLTWSRKIEGGNVAVFDELIECGHIGRRDLLPRCQLLVQLPAQHLEDTILPPACPAITPPPPAPKPYHLPPPPVAR